MKVFLSWSGDLSHAVAAAFRDWLPSVLQFTQPYVSSEDIDKGARWSTDIAQELEASSYGVILLTHQNIDAPWIAFEAGALSKALDKSRVSPFLVNLKRSELQGPLVQFQSTIYMKDDVLKLVTSINRSAPKDDQLEVARLQRVFDVWWPELQKTLDALLADQPAPQSSKATKKASDESAILEELLELVRSQQRILSDPSELLPPRYLQSILVSDGVKTRFELDPGALRFLVDRYDLLKGILLAILSKARPTINKQERQAISEELKRLDSVIRHLGGGRRLFRGSPRQLRLDT